MKHPLNKIMAVAVAMAILLSGCSTDFGNKPEEPSAEDRYVEQVTARYPMDDQDALDAGYAACKIVGTLGPQELFEWAVENDKDLEMTGFVAGSAVMYLCPEHKGIVQRYLDSQPKTVV